MEAAPNKFDRSKIILISLAHYIHDVYSSFLAPLLPLLIEKLSISYSAAGFLTVVQRLPTLINPFVGYFSDRIKARYLLIIAPSLTAFSMSLIGLASSYIVLVILLFMMGIGASIFHVPAPVLIKKISGDKVGKGMGYFMLSGEFARSTGPLVILWAVSTWGLEGSWRVMPAGLLFSFILFQKFRSFEISSGIKKDTSLGGIKATFAKLYPLLVRLAFVSFLHALIRSTLNAFLATYISEQTGDYQFGVYALAGYQLFGAAGAFVLGSWSDKIGKKRALLIISIVAPLSLLSFLLSAGYVQYLFLAIVGLTIFGTQPVLLALVNETDSNFPAMINGVYFSISFLAGSAAVMSLGFFADIFDMHTAFIISAVASLLSLAIIPGLIKSENKETS